MARTCDICGRGRMLGNRVARRGAPKRRGGAGRKITGVTRRKFQVNLQRVRVMVDGTPKVLRVCTRCLKAGKVLKAA